MDNNLLCEKCRTEMNLFSRFRKSPKVQASDLHQLEKLYRDTNNIGRANKVNDLLKKKPDWNKKDWLEEIRNVKCLDQSNDEWYQPNDHDTQHYTNLYNLFYPRVRPRR